MIQILKPVVLVPVSFKAWQRYGFASFGVLVVAAVIDDLLFFAADLKSVGWLNYAFVWLAVHQLGYAWRDGYLAGARQGLAWVVAGGLVLAGLVVLGPYPVSMVSVPGQEVSNTLPPKIAMLALGIVQCGLLLSIATSNTTAPFSDAMVDFSVMIGLRITS